MSSIKKTIGIRNESSLHRKLKFQYAGPKGKTEVMAGSYIADGINTDGEYIEVQIGSFGPLKDKIKELVSGGKVRIIHPIAVKKTIEVYKPAKRKTQKLGELLYRRKSPLKGSYWNIFDALLSAPELPLIQGLTIEVVLIDITEKRIKDGKGSWRRKGISLYDKDLGAFHEKIVFKKPKDFLYFIPFKKKEEFTSSLLAERKNINCTAARKALYVLTKMKLVKRIGKKKNSWVYTV
jgi:hypothetical protein